ncbi:ribonuclease [Colletotrichum kahawae]|uniref:Ribonuclease n=1 Tax=Colletotrichum kahawae TaxID=34407 RepID=A0AAE0CYI8_COLKA|nr:ribonuclease [Colletotrichum kahawae]
MSRRRQVTNLKVEHCRQDCCSALSRAVGTYKRTFRFPTVFGNYLDTHTITFEVVDDATSFIHVACPDHVDIAHIDSIVVAVKGLHAPRYSDDTSTVGVYFGPGNPNNAERFLSDGTVTGPRAELHAALAGLKISRQVCTEGGFCSCPKHEDGHECVVRHLIVKTESEYVARGMGGGERDRQPWIWRWRENGWLTINQDPVKNRDLWKALWRELKGLSEMGVRVDWWLVPESDNNEAYCVAGGMPSATELSPDEKHTEWLTDELQRHSGCDHSLDMDPRAAPESCVVLEKKA